MRLNIRLNAELAVTAGGHEYPIHVEAPTELVQIYEDTYYPREHRHPSRIIQEKTANDWVGSQLAEQIYSSSVVREMLNHGEITVVLTLVRREDPDKHPQQSFDPIVFTPAQLATRLQHYAFKKGYASRRN